jgi:hypothetical protein
LSRVRQMGRFTDASINCACEAGEAI